MKANLIFVLLLTFVAEDLARGEPQPEPEPKTLEQRVLGLENYLQQISSLLSDIEELKSEVTALEGKAQAASGSEVIAFYALLKKTTAYEDKEGVIFDNVITNFGGAYTDVCGTFKAPVHGLYFFHLFFIGSSKPNPATNLDIMVNGKRSCAAIGDKDHRHTTGTCSILVELQAGDLVHVEHEDPHGDGGEVWNGPYSGFNGYLYKQL